MHQNFTFRGLKMHHPKVCAYVWKGREDTFLHIYSKWVEIRFSRNSKHSPGLGFSTVVAVIVLFALQAK